MKIHLMMVCAVARRADSFGLVNVDQAKKFVCVRVCLWLFKI